MQLHSVLLPMFIFNTNRSTCVQCSFGRSFLFFYKKKQNSSSDRVQVNLLQVDFHSAHGSLDVCQYLVLSPFVFFFNQIHLYGREQIPYFRLSVQLLQSKSFSHFEMHKFNFHHISMPLWILCILGHSIFIFGRVHTLHVQNSVSWVRFSFRIFFFFLLKKQFHLSDAIPN